MRIEDLDEFQGMTPQMVREWLQELDPAIKPSDSMADDIRAVSELCGETPQALLREINPREREGVPSEAARQAHPGNWLVSGCLNQSKEKHFEVWHSRNLHLASNYPYNPDGKRIACWPLDEHGSKVRWPTDSEGKML